MAQTDTTISFHATGRVDLSPLVRSGTLIRVAHGERRIVRIVNRRFFSTISFKPTVAVNLFFVIRQWGDRQVGAFSGPTKI